VTTGDRSSRRRAGTSGVAAAVPSAFGAPSPVLTRPRTPASPADAVSRMLALAWQVTRRAGLSPRACARVCRDVLTDCAAHCRAAPDPRVPARLAAARERAAVLDALRARLRHRVAPATLERAIGAAVLLDELARLPPRQRAALTAAALHGRSVTEIAEQTGAAPHQVARLLRTALRTLAVRTH
jgi:hypothetical protein